MKERVRAIIIQAGKILLIKRIKPEETYWVLPGGGVETGESHADAIKRECVEELGLTVNVNDLFFRKTSEKPETKDQVEIFYLCDVVSGQLGTGQGPEFQRDTHYVGKYEPTWVDISQIAKLNFKPYDIRDLLAKKFSA
ncbi:MAG: NUDIX domain-containing protein [Candidatus Kerfeldbacteria bacterium]|nr:NUDIX domain-containing protein [Candidatus Kerfeldbacteria bacterium]